jgi:hypothetical protein
MKNLRKIPKLKIPHIICPTFLALVGLAALLAGCSLDKWIDVPAGEYALDTEAGQASRDAGETLEALRIDGITNTAVFEFTDGSEVAASFSARDRGQWPAGCPGSLYSVRMEVLDLEVEAVQIGEQSFPNPVLVRDCPPEPLQVLLRTDGPIGGAGTGCSNVNACVYFKLK